MRRRYKMSWIEKLYQTYESNTDKIGDPNDKIPLLPIFHTTKKRAHVEVVVDGQGVFKRASVISENDAKTILPATESSAGRTSGCAPHPLAEQLQYIAADYEKYGGTKGHYFHSLLVKFKGNEKSFNNLLHDGSKDKQGCLARISRENQRILESENNFSRQKKLFASIMEEDIRRRQTDQIYYNLLNPKNSLIRKEDDLLTEKKRKEKKQYIYLLKRVDNADNFHDRENVHLKAAILEFIYPSIEAGYAGYLEVLEEWVESGFANEKIKAVYKYIRKGKLITDLVRKKVLYIDDETGTLLKKWHGRREEKPDIFRALGQGQTQIDVFIRWCVEIPGERSSDLQFDKSVWQSWIDYYLSTRKYETFCFVSGESKSGCQKFQPEQYPRMIRSANDGAKLISSNDTSGFTFRGRFTDEYQVCGVDVIIAQKAHSALRWLLGRQGKVFFVKNEPKLAIVAWAVSGMDIPDPLVDSDDLLNDDSTINEASSGARIQNGFTAQDFGVRLSQYLSGYSVKLGSADEIIVMGVDSATPGRMVLTYYRELTGSDFLKRIETWHKGCAWLQHFSKDKEFYGAPSPKDIAQAAYGTKDDDLIKVDDNVQKTTVERLIPCVIDGVPLAWDIVESCIRKAVQRYSLPDWAWQKALGIACGLYKYYFKEREDYTMGLERERKTRDYLYGRLLAVADCLESTALYVASENSKNRQTSATKLMQRFAERPSSTWKTIELALVPYKARLSRSNKYEKEMDLIHGLFTDVEGYSSDSSLSGEFLLGFHCQRLAFNPENNANKETNDELNEKN